MQRVPARELNDLCRTPSSLATRMVATLRLIQAMHGYWGRVVSGNER
jgi:hypothetical protein